MTAQAGSFDSIANDYRELWDESDIGRLQRNAVWRYLGPLFRAGDRVLDLGCGVGEDALRFGELGIAVTGIDASPEMVRIARERGVGTRLCRIEDLGRLKAEFDGAYSDFGAFNCVRNVAALREPLGASIVPGGMLALCVIGRFCLMETLWFLLHCDPRSAVRRWRGTADSSLGLRVFYPTVGAIEKALAPTFELVRAGGIGIFVPPSFVRVFSAGMLWKLDRLDRVVSAWLPFRILADHRILIFRKR